MKELIKVSFPGLGIEPFTLNKIAFTIGTVEVRWYGVLITCGILLAFLYAIYRGKHNEGVGSDDIIDIGLLTVVLGVLGARLYYVLTSLDKFHSFYDVIAIWNGGLGIYGGIIGGCAGILIVCAIKKIRWTKAFDMIGPGVMLAQAIGRWGNFFNGEAHGYAIGETTQFYFMNREHFLNSGEGTLFHTFRMGLSQNASRDIIYYYHPTFLYECIWNLFGFLLINLFYKHKRFDGQIALMYFTWYGFGRMFIEGFRTDSLYIPGTTLRISQCVGLFCFVVGSALLIFFSFIKKPPLATVSAKHGDEANQTAPSAADNAALQMTDRATDDEPAHNEENCNEDADRSEACTENQDAEENENGKID